MKVIVAGGRDFKDYMLLADKLDKILFNAGEEVEIISGGQVTIDPNTGEKYGADYLGEQYAKNQRHCALKVFPADWATLGKKAGPFRNLQMAQYSDALVAFWDGKSKGTKNMVDTAHFLNLKVRVIKY